MDFFDIVFPINLNPLTYRCPEELLEHMEPGMMVSAPLKNRTFKGIIIGRSFKAPSGDIKDIQKVHGETPVLSSKMLGLLKWMSEYYLTEQGIVLKNMLPKEAFTKVHARKTKIFPHPKEGRKDHLLPIITINDETVSNLTDSLQKNTYRTFLLHAPSTVYEYSFVIKILTETKNVILLVSEVSYADNLYPLLKDTFGERVCIFHSGLSRGKRSEAIERISSGYSDIMLGTRSAVFAPLKKVSFIAVLREHSSSYKQENGLRYSGRDVAVMRGYLEKATVLLSSISPSIESLYNCRSGKYTLLKSAGETKKPRIKIIDMRYEKLPKPCLSKTVIDASTRYIKNDKKVMFVINRRGHSTLLQCSECHNIEECPDCGIPLVFHKQKMSLKCHYCKYTVSRIPEICQKCKGYTMELIGAGTQRVQEGIEELLGIKTLRLDSDMTQKRSDIEELIGATYRNDVRIIIGTKLMTKRLGITDGFSMAALLNTDLYLNLPDFRSAEKAYQEILFIIDKIASHGELFIQTRMPQHYLFNYLKKYDYQSFFIEELHRRKSLSYPPYSKLLLFKIICRRDISMEVSGVIGKINKKDVEILGPSLSKSTQGKHEYRLLLKSSIRGSLHSAAKIFIETFKDLKEVKIKVDVDPISI
ncbi:MAG: primosomal protein N' [Nitrospirota bacterium]|nr:primosomal protein N' [Nitrospirota bacterium]